MAALIKADARTGAIKTAAAAGIFFFCAFLFILRPQQTAEGISQSVSLCLTSIVPSLFPFLFLSSFAVSSGLYIFLSKPFAGIMQLLFRLPAESASILLIGLTGGYPVGTQMTGQALADGRLTQEEAKRLCLFAVNAGPAFVIGTVGGQMLSSRKAGILLYASLSIASLTAGILTRGLYRSAQATPSNPQKAAVISHLSIADALNTAACKAPRSTVNICVWIVLFGSVLYALGLQQPKTGLQMALTAILEVTTGCKAAAGLRSIPLIAGLLGFGGISVHCQLVPTLTKIGADLRLFFAFRVLTGILAALLCEGLLKIFPIETAAFASFHGCVTPAVSSGIPVSVAMLLMSALLLLGENFKIKLR